MSDFEDDELDMRRDQQLLENILELEELNALLPRRTEMDLCNPLDVMRENEFRFEIMLLEMYQTHGRHSQNY